MSLERESWKVNLNCTICNFLKSEVGYSYETLSKFTKGIENLDKILSQWVIYSKFSIGYEPKINSKKFNNIYINNKSSKCNMIKYDYCNKNDHAALLCFVRKSHENKNIYFLSHFYKKNTIKT